MFFCLLQFYRQLVAITQVIPKNVTVSSPKIVSFIAIPSKEKSRTDPGTQASTGYLSAPVPPSQSLNSFSALSLFVYLQIYKVNTSQTEMKRQQNIWKSNRGKDSLTLCVRLADFSIFDSLNHGRSNGFLNFRWSLLKTASDHGASYGFLDFQHPYGTFVDLHLGLHGPNTRYKRRSQKK